MTEITTDINQMHIELRDLAQPDWDDDQVEHLYRALLNPDTTPIAVDILGAGLKLGKIDWSERNPI